MTACVAFKHVHAYAASLKLT